MHPARAGAEVFDALKAYYERRGQLDKAVDHMHRKWLAMGEYLTPIMIVDLTALEER